MWRFGTDADVAVRDQAVRAGGGSRGELMVPLYSARWALVSPFLYELGGWEPRAHRQGGFCHEAGFVLGQGTKPTLVIGP